MKKLWHEERWRRQQNRRRRWADATRRRESRARSPWRRRFTVGPGERVRVEAPETFSMILNPEGTIRFLQAIEACFLQNLPIDIDLSKVTRMTVDAALLLRSRLPPKKRYRGNFPSDPVVNGLFTESGFMQQVHSSHFVAQEPKGSFERASSATAKPGMADEMILGLTRQLFGAEKRSPGSYTTIIECMNNTRNWAHVPGAGLERWWLMRYCDQASGRGIFAFADNGVGILKSANINKWRRGLSNYLDRAKASVIRDLMDGKIPSSSNLPNRGLGLPGMKNDCTDGLIKGLKIITNNVYADVAAGTYTTLGVSFRGTLIYWELGETL